MSKSVNISRPTFRGIGDRPAENSWFPLWLLNRMAPLNVQENPDILFYGDIGNGEHLLYPSKTIRVFLTGENIPPNWDEADYALTHERIWNDRHWRAPLWRHFYDPGHTHVERNFEVVKARVDRFCNFIYSNDRAKERIEFFHRLSAYKPVDSGGRILNNIGGPVADKRAYLARCKFTIAFENESHPGYATEKIIEPLLMGSIPIYWGDPQIEDDFNPDCLINVHRFRNLDEVINRVRQIDSDDGLWKQYVTAPLFRDGRLPDQLSNNAYKAFFDDVVTKGPQISPSRRIWQRLTIRRRQFYGRLNGLYWRLRHQPLSRIRRLFK
jgi:hypothetical protein